MCAAVRAVRARRGPHHSASPPTSMVLHMEMLVLVPGDPNNISAWVFFLTYLDQIKSKFSEIDLFQQQISCDENEDRQS